ncbi:hypothetical protein [Acidisphaera sp. L21]|jgi:hypothetical protein|uniref:hypothetical protein n=1 Tax=Acidisphaera sp. L21 TaxID=1641851 RepID=UPI00131C09D5|nr:hypothetical protein [Acidisphaera sp. L21]
MPFDGSDFDPRPPRGRPPVNETAMTVAVVLFALSMLIMPISLGGLVDIIRYIHGHH